MPFIRELALRETQPASSKIWVTNSIFFDDYNYAYYASKWLFVAQLVKQLVCLTRPPGKERVSLNLTENLSCIISNLCCSLQSENNDPSELG